MKYKIVNSDNPFYEKIFNGEIIIIEKEPRIWDNDSTGRSYPASDCYPILNNGEDYSYDICCKNGLSHIFNQFGDIVYHSCNTADIYMALKFNNGKRISNWVYRINRLWNV